MVKSWSLFITHGFVVALHFYYMFDMICVAHAKIQALYVFGDSFVDIGNTDFMDTSWSINYYPYGEDFRSILFYELHVDGGRYTNGNTIPEILADSLDLAVLRSFLMTPESIRSTIVKGFDYAYGPAGILPDTGKQWGTTISLRDQINLFNDTIKKHLSMNFKSARELSQHLSESIFMVHIGSHDYLNSLFSSDFFKFNYNNELYAERLANVISDQLKDLYDLGARKILIFEIPAIGCMPRMLNGGLGCNATVNDMVTIYNRKLTSKINELAASLYGSTFVIAKTFNVTLAMANNPNQFGLIDSRNACCQLRKNDSTGLCTPHVDSCPDRNTHLFYDSIHFTETAYTFIAKECFDGQNLCIPNIKSLTMT